MEPENWHNPIHKVKPPKVSNEPIEGASIDQIKKMLATCNDDFIGIRDRAMLLFLLDSGVRVQKLIDMNINNALDDGAVVVEHGKGDKPRITYIGNKASRSLRKYLRCREDENPALGDHPKQPRRGRDQRSHDYWLCCHFGSPNLPRCHSRTSGVAVWVATPHPSRLPDRRHLRAAF
jgi:integrase